MSDIDWKQLEEIRAYYLEGNAPLQARIDMATMFSAVDALRAEVAKEYGSGDLEKRFYTVSSIDKLKAERERLIDAAWKFLVKKVPNASCDEIRTALASTPQRSLEEK